MNILWTGSAGFVAGYAIPELLNNGHRVVGIDNYSKYGYLKRDYDNHKNYTLIEGDVKDVELLKHCISDSDVLVANAAVIGGISFFHNLAYDLLAENERIMASTFDAAIYAHKNFRLKKVVVFSSSMVYGNSEHFPSKEGDTLDLPPPLSTYGFQKLACEYFAKGAWEQYQLPYTVLRLFNCVGIGEKKTLRDVEISSGDMKIALGHVVPDLIRKILAGQDPLRILGTGDQTRTFTYGGDLARGIRIAIEDQNKSINETFNLSNNAPMTVAELAEIIWKKIHPEKPFRIESDTPYTHDIKKRIPDTSKAEKILGFTANTPIDYVIDEFIPVIKQQLKRGEF